MRIPQLEGLRGIAILLVLCYHQALFQYFGWAGVDLFFVLSGFLITEILRRQRSSRTYWRSFYVKRGARILPALCVTLAAIALIARHLSWLGFAGYALFFGNVVNLTRFHIPLLEVLWSLAIEEHFYLVWPLLVRFTPRSHLIGILLAVVIAEPVVRVLALPHTTEAAVYFLTPFRLDSIALGSLLALLRERPRVRLWTRYSGTLALALSVLFTLLTLRLPRFYHEAQSVSFAGGGYSLIALICFFIVTWSLNLRANHVVAQVLSSAPLRYLGRISYGVYLYHMPLRALIMKLLHIPFQASSAKYTYETLPLLVISSVAVAGLSFHYVEVPIIRWAARKLGSSDVADESMLTRAAFAAAASYEGMQDLS